jgi:hypothetical protein
MMFFWNTYSIIGNGYKNDFILLLNGNPNYSVILCKLNGVRDMLMQ